jgi:pilus assembly protein CpaB
MFQATQIVTKQVSAGALADVAALRGKVAAVDIYPGQQLTAADFTTSGGLPAKLAPAQRAVTVSLDSAHGMVGAVQNGDHVDVYAGFQLDNGTGRTVPALRLLIPNVQVLKAGTTSSTTGVGTGPNTTSDVTLNVNNAQAGELAFAADNGKVWLVLRPANATSTAAPSPVTVQSLLFAIKPVPTGGKK